MHVADRSTDPKHKVESEFDYFDWIWIHQGAVPLRGERGVVFRCVQILPVVQSTSDHMQAEWRTAYCVVTDFLLMLLLRLDFCLDLLKWQANRCRRIKLHFRLLAMCCCLRMTDKA